MRRNHNHLRRAAPARRVRREPGDTVGFAGPYPAWVASELGINPATGQPLRPTTFVYLPTTAASTQRRLRENGSGL